MALINKFALTNQQDEKYQLFNQSENDLNTHSGISASKKEMMAEQIITKEFIFMKSKNEKLKALQAYKSPKLNLFYKIDLKLYSLLQKVQIQKLGFVFCKNTQK